MILSSCGFWLPARIVDHRQKKRPEALVGALAFGFGLQGPLRTGVLRHDPKGPKYSTIGCGGLLILGIIILVFGRYLLFGHLDPYGEAWTDLIPAGSTFGASIVRVPNSRALIWTPNTRALRIRTPTNHIMYDYVWILWHYSCLRCHSSTKSLRKAQGILIVHGLQTEQARKGTGCLGITLRQWTLGLLM